jgi:hypothetical protein
MKHKLARGGVIASLSRLGLEHNRPATNPSFHGHPMTVWPTTRVLRDV